MFLGPAHLELRACSQDLQGCEVQGCVSEENSQGSIKAGRKQGIYANGRDMFVSCSCLLPSGGRSTVPRFWPGGVAVFSRDTLSLRVRVRGPRGRAC